MLVLCNPATLQLFTFDDYAIHETESVNFIKSGRQWFGELFDNISSYNFSFSFPNIVTSSPVKVKVALASRLVQSGSSSNASYSITSGSGSSSLSIPSVDGSVYSDYARIASTCYTYNPASSVVTVNVTKQTANAQAWLDYIVVNARRNLIMSGSQMHFRDAHSIGAGNVAQYNLASNSFIQVWDFEMLQMYPIKFFQFLEPTISFQCLPIQLKEYFGFSGASYLSPSKLGKNRNQDLHGIAQKDYIIVTHPDFYDEAVRLALYHENADTLSTVVVTPQQIYNEFSSGSRDISAIRNFVKMFYDRAATASERPKYLLLMGDGSFENKKNYLGNTNFIPTYQSYNSTILTQSYVSDDYFGLLDDDEGLFGSDAVDIGVGRFPVKSKSEAVACVNKVLDYTRTGFDYTAISNACTSGLASSSPFGDWRNVITFVGDDEDGGLHQKDADKLATLVDTSYNNYNIDKIYLDAFVQESTPGGQRFPAAKEAINKRMEKGCLIWNYTGHGGELGLAHERVVEVADVNNWTNINNLLLVFTATCEFTHYDDPERTSARRDGVFKSLRWWNCNV
ncbi:MAG: type IX secretion system sortase PorU [Bacteroidetes bacterium]|nr:type IX secretion system sortase PorU [Bacteroidota bacterium]